MNRGIRNVIQKATMAALLFLLLFSAIPVAHAAGTVTAAVPVYKAISGGTPAKAEVFTFVLTAQNGAPMPAGSVNGTKSASITGAGNGTFGTITFDEVGDYRYTIRETAGSNAAYTYDSTVYDLTVQVTWAGDVGGDLKAVQYLHKDGETTKQEKALFTNGYKSGSVLVDPPVQKVISGDTPSTSGTFVFYLKADDAAYPMPSGSTGGTAVLSITGAGTKDFGNITFTQAGTYTYTVYERKGSLGGYKYDTTVYTMKIVVTQDGSGTLTAARTITDSAGKTQSGLTFVNEYDESTDPKTGDASLRSLWWILLLAAGAGVGLALYLKNRQKRRK